MRTPVRSTGAETCLRGYGLYHLARLMADPDLKQLADEFAQAQATLGARIAQHRAARERAMEAMAARDGKEMALDAAVRNLSLAIHSKVQTNRNSVTLHGYFPEGLSGVIRLPLDAKLRRVGVILSELADEADELVQAHAAPLAQAVEEMQAALANYKAACADRANTAGQLLIEKLNWLNAYQGSYHALRIRFVDDSRMAESFFKRSVRPRSVEDEEEQPGATGDAVEASARFVPEEVTAIAR